MLVNMEMYHDALLQYDYTKREVQRANESPDYFASVMHSLIDVA